jgi:hypothetical protein
MTGIGEGAAIAANATQISQQLGLIEAIKQKLVKQPDDASGKLVAVLEELQKSYIAFDGELVRFFAVTLDPGPELRNDMQTLYSLEGQLLWARLNSARGHCGKIENIYEKYLSPWFQRVTELDKSERDDLENLFKELSSVDAVWVRVLNDAAYWLGQRAEEALAAQERSDTKAALNIIAKARRDIAPTRRQLADAMSKMRQLEADFIQVGGVT